MVRGTQRSLIDAHDIVARISTVLITGTVLMLSLGISGGGDADDHPPIDELLRMEMGRVLTLRRIQAEFPEYKDVLDASLAREIMCQPWEALQGTGDVLRALAGRIVDRCNSHAQGFPIKRFLDQIEYQAIRSDPVIFALLRRGCGPMITKERIGTIVDECCDVLDVDYDSVIDDVHEIYDRLLVERAQIGPIE